jgi:hypothetical protein
VRAAGRNWREGADHFRRFVEEDVIVDGTSTMTAMAMHMAYEKWAPER